MASRYSSSSRSRRKHVHRSRTSSNSTKRNSNKTRSKIRHKTRSKSRSVSKNRTRRTRSRNRNRYHRFDGHNNRHSRSHNNHHKHSCHSSSCSPSSHHHFENNKNYHHDNSSKYSHNHHETKNNHHEKSKERMKKYDHGIKKHEHRMKSGDKTVNHHHSPKSYQTQHYNNHNNHNNHNHENDNNHYNNNNDNDNNNTNNHNDNNNENHVTNHEKSKEKSIDSNDNAQDLEGIVKFHINDIIQNRYKIISKLGQGTFGSVVECIDTKREIKVAMKIVRSVKRYLEASEIEIKILEKLNKLDTHRNSLIIKLLKSFKTQINKQPHTCLIFERCGSSLYDYIKMNQYCGFPLFSIAIIGFQLFHSIAFCHNNKLTHTDLKLENILFLNDDKIPYKLNNEKVITLPKYYEIRLIDFGGATWDNDHHSSIINTRQYRGPEIILGLSWNHSSDIWSIGCILAELFTGELLFGTHEDIEHLALMEKILNRKLPKFCVTNAFEKTKYNQHRIRRSPNSGIGIQQMFNEETKALQWPSKASNHKTVEYVQNCQPLENIITDQDLCLLIRQCLQYDPLKRIQADRALDHPFFKKYFNEHEFQRILNRLQIKS